MMDMSEFMGQNGMQLMDNRQNDIGLQMQPFFNNMSGQLMPSNQAGGGE